jgi:hypothetical protein
MYVIELGSRTHDQEREMMGWLREHKVYVKWINAHKISLDDPEAATYLKLAYGK